MLSYIIRRTLYMIPTLILISVVSFVLIQLPPGDYVTSWMAELQAQGTKASQAAAEALRIRYGLDQPIYKQYWLWISGFIRGDFGISMIYSNTPVSTLIGGRLALTFIISLISLIFAWGIAIPIGIYSATHKYGILDYISSFFCYIGLATPNFMFALVLLFIAVFYFNAQFVGGLFSPAYMDASWSLGKVIDLIKHLPMPVIVIGTNSMASTMRIMRGNLLDILGKQYIQTARSKGLKERIVIYKHAVRIAINPLISRLGLELPYLFSGAMLTSIILNLPTVGPLFYQAIMGQDMYLAGTILLMLAVLLVLGNLMADILLAVSDPRIRYD